MSEYLTTTEYAARLGIDPSRVRRLLLAGRIPGARKHGRASWMIPVDARPTPAIFGPPGKWSIDPERGDSITGEVNDPLYHYTDRLSGADILRIGTIKAHQLVLYSDLLAQTPVGTTPPIVWLTTERRWDETVARKLQAGGWPYPPYEQLWRFAVRPDIRCQTLEQFSKSTGIAFEQWSWVIVTAELVKTDWHDWRIVDRNVARSDWLGIERLTRAGEWTPVGMKWE